MSNTNTQTTETTTTETTTKSNKGNGYPFVSQREISEQIATSYQFRVEALNILCGRQTADELEEKATLYVNKKGLRCSEAVWFPQLAAKLQNSPEDVTPVELERLQRTLPVYRKQLAAHFRAEMLERQPELAAQAARFGL